ncbi:MCE family protein [Rhodococcus opacus]|uniref:MCE family protein n=1 Tax=Rhodococcus opacus TaxID=37919 RepID=UPI002474CC9F|nr:MCE family protein [Rhodococcus opacus]MDH6293334.1 phospholipid/cholesterol/gamma-HCH transport system substrate-binding protein [Rhodococcus opacus]
MLNTLRSAAGRRGRAVRSRRIWVAALVVVIVALVTATGWTFYRKGSTTTVTAYFPNTNGIYVGDQVKILGVDVGRIDAIEPDGERMKVTFHYDSQYQVPQDAKAAILSPSLVTSRAIQLTPAYTGGPALTDHDEIPLEHTAVPIEWDDFRAQLQHLSESLGPTEQSANGPLGQFVNDAADSLSGKGADINATLIKLSEAMSTLSDGRDDVFATVRNLQVFVSALAASDRQIVELNQNLASVSGVLTNSDQELATSLDSVDALVQRIGQFVSDNREGLGKSVDDLAAVTTTLHESSPEIEQILHVLPNTLQNFYNIYQPAQGTMTGALAVTQMQNPIQFICGAIQAASQKGAAESAKLCVQHLAPVLNLIQMNYPPVGVSPITSVQVRPDQVDYSEDSLRDSVPTAPVRTVDSRSGIPGLLGLTTPSATGGR